jgi:hypothetical protein
MPEVKSTKSLDCYLRGAKSPERIEPKSNLVGNLKGRTDAKRSDAIPEPPLPLAADASRKR